MTTTIIVTAADTWVNGAAGKTGANYGDTAAVHVRAAERRGLVRPAIPNILGRTVSSAVLYGHAGPGGLVAQQFSLAPATQHWTQGRATWANQPAVDETAYVFTTVGVLAEGDLVAFGVTAHLQAVADGVREWEGWRLGTDSAALGQRFTSTQSGEPAWELHITLADDTEQPSNLRPDGGAVATAEPVLAWDYVEGEEVSAQASARVEVREGAEGVDPNTLANVFDSGFVTNVAPQYDLAASTYAAGAGPVHYWRVTVRDADGNESAPSDWADYTASTLPTLVVDSPVGAFGDPTPTVLAHLASGTLETWEAWVTGPDRADVRATTGASTGPIDWEVPFKNKDGRRVVTHDEAGWLYIRAYDDVDRAVAVGQNPYAEAWVPLQLTDSEAVVKPTGLVVAQVGEGDPRQKWSFRRTEAAAAYLLRADGVDLVRVDAADVTVDAGVYTFVDGGEVPPLRTQRLTVAAVDGDQTGESAGFYSDHHVSKVWLLHEDHDPVSFGGVAGDDVTRSDRRATFTPVTGDDVDIIYDFEGLRGAFQGGISAATHDDVWAVRDRIKAIAKSKKRKARLVYGSESITVVFRDLLVAPHPTMDKHNLRHKVSFSFVQVGD